MLLMMAFESGSDPVIKALLERKAHITAKDKRGRTVLHRAAASGSSTMAFLAVHCGKKNH
jgi:ankyrin repeat protein